MDAARPGALRSCNAKSQAGNMAIYTKHGQRLAPELARTDPSCFLGDKPFRIRAIAETDRKEQVYWVRDLLADNGRAEIEAFISNLRRET
jgi:hypothetical protein